MKMTSLEEMLSAREERAAIQSSLIEKEGKALISFTMNIPGPVKNNEWIQKSFEYGKEDMLSYMAARNIEVREVLSRNLATGPEGYFVIDSQCGAEDIKKNLMEFEETHSIGRWFDIDVKSSSGRALSREEIGGLPRKCFLCDQDAKACGRSRRHSVEELYEVTDRSLRQFIENETHNHMKSA